VHHGTLLVVDARFASGGAPVLRAVAAAELAQLALDLGLDVERLAPPARAALVARDDERAHLGFEARVRGRPVELAQLRLDVDRLEARRRRRSLRASSSWRISSSRSRAAVAPVRTGSRAGRSLPSRRDSPPRPILS
jgi:hypothetical protein